MKAFESKRIGNPKRNNILNRNQTEGMLRCNDAYLSYFHSQ